MKKRNRTIIVLIIALCMTSVIINPEVWEWFGLKIILSLLYLEISKVVGAMLIGIALSLVFIMLLYNSEMEKQEELK